MNRKQKIIVSITGIFIVLLALVGLTYAYFLTRITGNENEKSISVTTANLELVYGDDDGSIIGDGKVLMPDNDNPVGTKVFTVTNNGNETVEDYAVILENFAVKYHSGSKAGEITNFVNGEDGEPDLKLVIGCRSYKDYNGAKTETGTCNGMDGFLPEKSDILVINDIDKDITHEYTVTLTYLDDGTNQTDDMNKTIEGKFNIIDTKNTIDITGTIETYTKGDIVTINSEYKESVIYPDGTYKLMGVKPDVHTIRVVGSTTKEIGKLSIIKGTTASTTGTTTPNGVSIPEITITDASRVVKIDVTSSYELNINETIDLYNPTPMGTLAFSYSNGNSLSFTTNKIVEDVDIKTDAVSLPFSVTNIGNDHMKLTIKIADISMDAALKNIDFRWGLYNADSGNGLSFGTFKYTGNEEIVYRDVVLDAVEPHPTQNFILRIWVHNNGTAQTELLNKSFKGTVQVIGEKVEYTPEDCFTLTDMGGGNYAIMDGKAAIESYDSSCGSEILIPKTIKGYELFEAIINGSEIKTVLSSLLGNSFFPSFISSTKLTHITIPENINDSLYDGNLYDYFFQNIPLDTIFIPESTFGLGPALLSVTKPVVIPKSLILSTSSFIEVGDFIIMNGIENIPSNMVDNIKSETLEIPVSVTTIESGAFSFYPNINSVKIIVRGKTEVPSGFADGWNIAGRDYNWEFRYAEVEFRP